MKRCKHQNGLLHEISQAAHTRDVINGALASEGTNDIGNIDHYEYECRDCRRSWRFDGWPKQKWLKKIHDQLANDK